MATLENPLTLPPNAHRAPRPSASVAGEQRIAIRDIPWELYERLSDAVGENSNVRLAYDGRDLEIMTVGPNHENTKEILARFVNAVSFELKIRCRGLGQTTWKRPELLRGLEADLCYFFDPEKLAMIADALAHKSNKIDDYPNPDIAIEIDISPSQIDRPSVYRALAVFEVWRFDGESLVIEQFGLDGSYKAVESSRFLFVQTTEVLRWIVQEDFSDDLVWEQRLRDWVRHEVVPR